ncbi:unnamed protein product [Ilex paraguariensis]|uniref:Uncharacterized protein n=1 Tax=Ilex paraguariensis TaxID=185542 RepID=A0ABC8SZ31_9AQUA
MEMRFKVQDRGIYQRWQIPIHGVKTSIPPTKSKCQKHPQKNNGAGSAETRGLNKTIHPSNIHHTSTSTGEKARKPWKLLAAERKQRRADKSQKGLRISDRKQQSRQRSSQNETLQSSARTSFQQSIIKHFKVDQKFPLADPTVFEAKDYRGGLV